MTAQPQMQAPAPGFQARNTPSQRGPVALLIIGLVLTFLITPMIVVTMASVKGVNVIEDFTKNGKNIATVHNGDEIRVGDTGVVALLLTPANEDAECTLSDANSAYKMEKESGVLFATDVDEMQRDIDGTTMTATGLKEGTYDLQCKNLADGTAMRVIEWGFIRDVATTAIIAVIFAGATGLVGIGLSIAGFIWILVVARRRRQMTQMGYAPMPPQGQ